MKILNSNIAPVVTQKSPQDEKLKEVAALYEKEFTRQLLKSMRATVPKSGLVNENQAEKIFSDELYNSYGDLLAEQGPGSLRDHIYQNLLDKIGPSLGIKGKELKSIGFLPLPKADVKLKVLPQNPKDPAAQSYRFSWIESDQVHLNKELVSPWSAEVVGVNQFGNNQGAIISLLHENGLISDFKILGQATVKVGDELNAGQQIAELDQIGKELVWNIRLKD